MKIESNKTNDKPKLTTCQQIIYNCIVKYIDENYASPTVREIRDMAGLNSVSTVAVHLKNLKTKGYINYMPRKKRSIEIPEMLEKTNWKLF